MGPEENWQKKVTLPPHTLLPLLPEFSFNPSTFNLTHLGFPPSSTSVFQIHCYFLFVWDPFCWHARISLLRVSFFPPRSSHPSATAKQWANVWQSLFLILSHTNLYPYSLNDLSVLSWCVHHFCCGFKSVQFLFFYDWLLCSLLEFPFYCH